MEKFFDQRLEIKITKELKERIMLVAKEEEKSVSEYLRKIIEAHITAGNMEENKGEIYSYVSKAVHDQLEPVEERLAKICAKTAHAAAISMFMNLQVIFDLEKKDAMEIWKIARGKGLAFVRDRGIYNTGEIEQEMEEILNEKERGKYGDEVKR
ncbi:hypothetical protein LR013_00355 [candidate division NPL-UPA2 bacterium]|nr:hypothetical protein [candidate division NPL-UPA2 bacterium]